jgi:hypothetical protein
LVIGKKEEVQGSREKEEVRGKEEEARKKK